MFVYNSPSVRATNSVSGRIRIGSWTMDQSDSSRGREESKGQFKHVDKFSTTELVRDVGPKVRDMVSECLKASNALFLWFYPDRGKDTRFILSVGVIPLATL